MNKSFSGLIVAASLAFLGAGCQTSSVQPSVQPSPIPQPEPTQSATGAQDVAPVDLNVTWSTPKTIAPIDVFTAEYKGIGQPVGDEYRAKYFVDREHYHEVGMVKDGPYAGGKVVIIDVAPVTDGPAGEERFHLIVPKTGKPVFLTRYAPSSYSDANLGESQTFDAKKMDIDTAARLPGLAFLRNFTYAGSSFTMEPYMRFFQGDPETDAPFFDPKGTTKAFIIPGIGQIYMDAPSAVPGTPRMNGFYAIAPDGTVRVYDMRIPFFDKDTHVPRVTWSDGSPNAKEYWAVEIGGCGASSYASVADGVTKDDLVAVGKTEQGDQIYAFKDANHPYLKTLYKTTYMLGREGSSDALSFADFVKAEPIFLWIDPLGRVLKFQKAEYLPAVECGKPVIYLYPPKTEDISVHLAPQGGFTKSEPAYDGGWNVRVTPTSELTDLKDGKTYPYLFWEGRGGMYRTPDRGWSVAQKDVRAFLTAKLTALGLNAKELADFMEFWEPRMQGSPYYFVTFLGNQAMDALAPMDVTPTPDHVIRILMDYQPLPAPIDVQGFAIRTPVRDGFTVVEWGGVLR